MSANPHSSEYQNFLDQKHASLIAPEELVLETVRDITGASLLEKSRIVKGEINEVYKGKISDGREIIIRIGRSEFVKFQRERWALAQCARVGVPVPVVYGIQSTKHEGKEFNFSVESLLPGVPLNEMPGIFEPANAERLRNILRSTGDVLAKVHSVPTFGYGELDGEGRAEADSIAASFEGSPYLSQERMRDLAEKSKLDPAVMDKAVSHLRDSLGTYIFDHPKLVHGDFAPKHLLIENDRVSGIIDFENAEGGDPARDFAYWQFFEPEYPIEVLMEGYWDKSLFDSKFADRVKFWRLYVGITTLEYAVQQGNTLSVNETSTQLTKDVEALRRG